MGVVFCNLEESWPPKYLKYGLQQKKWWPIKVEDYNKIRRSRMRKRCEDVNIDIWDLNIWYGKNMMA